MAGTGEFDYEVECFLDKRVGESSQVEYLVHWKGFSPEWDTWEPAGNLGNCKQKIKKFEKERKKKLANTQKIAKRLLHKSMARQDQAHHAVIKSNIKSRKKQKQSLDKRVKKAAKKSTPDNINSSMTLDDVFEAVVNGTSINGTVKKSSGKGRKSLPSVNNANKLLNTSKSKGKTLVAKKIVSTAKKKQQNKNEAKSVQALGAKKLSLDANKAKGMMKQKKNLKRKSDSEILNSSKIAKLERSQSKTAKTKSWTAVDEEISFSSDDELVNKSVEIHETNHIEKIPVSLVNKTNASLKMNKSKGKMKKELTTEKNCKAKSLKQNLNSPPKSAFRPVNKKKDQLKLSISHLIGSKKKTEAQLDNEQNTHGSTCIGKDEAKVKKKKKELVAKKGELDKSDVNIETDMESDEEILYSLSDNSDLGINDTSASKDESPKDTEIEISRSMSESHVDQDQKVKGRKPVAKKSKSTSETVSGKSKKIKLLDSLKPISPVQHVRPVSPTPVYTTVKHTATSGNILQSSQPLLAQPQWVLDDGITPNTAQSASLPISPASMSYKVLLENLPHQLHPKNKKRPVDKEDSDIERRVSVRASECAFKYKEIVIKKCQRYTQIWLNTHTKMKNALNPLVMQEISSALNAAKYDDSNLVMFSGLGNVFCSGIDLHFLTVGDKKVAARQMADALRDLVRKFITFPKLIVAVVTGPAIGMGSALLPLCDIVYASDKATFYMPYAQLSQTPEGCASFTLPNIVGIAMANELLVGGRKITAIEACQLGFVSQVYWPTSMMQEVIPRIQHMASGSGKVLETTKLLVRSHQRTKLDLTNESECNLLVDRWPATECQRAIEEFLSNEKNYML